MASPTRMSPLIRRAERGDARAVARIRIAGWRSAYVGIVDANVLRSLDEDMDTVRTEGYLSDPGSPSRTLVSVDGAGEVTGFVVTGPDRDDGDPAVGEVWALYVDPVASRSGHGRALLTTAAETLQSDDRVVARLWVLEHNLAGRAFYAAHGFAPDGGRQPLETLPDPDGRPVFEVRYRKLLTGAGNVLGA